jgi:hypothetical protein
VIFQKEISWSGGLYDLDEIWVQMGILEVEMWLKEKVTSKDVHFLMSCSIHYMWNFYLNFHLKEYYDEKSEIN